MRLRGPTDLLAIIAASILLVPFIILDVGAMRIIFGLPFILFFPGYALIALLFPRRTDIDIIERVALSFGLSIALVPLVGLLLNYVWEIRLFPILISLEILTIGLCAGAWYRRASMLKAGASLSIGAEDATDDTEEVKKTVKRPAAVQAQKTTREDVFLSWNVSISFPEWKSYGKLDKALTVILALAIVASVVTLAYVIVTPKTGERFTEFYVLGPGGKADGYPTKMNWSQSGTVIIGVANHEYANKTYRIDVILHNESIKTILNFSLDQHPVAVMPHYNESVKLPHLPVNIDEPWRPQWEIPFNFTIAHPSDYRLEFLLFMADNETALASINPLNAVPYRSLHLWVRDFAIFDQNGNALPPLAQMAAPASAPNGTINLTAICDFAREIFATRYVANQTIKYTIVAKQGGANGTELLRAPFTVTKINKTAANVTFNGETFRMPASLRIPISINAAAGAPVQFLVFRNGDYSKPFRSAVWNE